MSTLSKNLPPKPNIELEDVRYWRNFNVNIDKILSDWKTEASEQIEFLSKFNFIQLERLRQIYNLKVDDKDILSTIGKNEDILLELIASNYFFNLNRKTIARSIQAPHDNKGIPIEIDTVLQIVELHRNNQLIEPFVEHLRMKLGKGDFSYKLGGVPNAENLSEFVDNAISLPRALGFSSSEPRSYKFRFLLVRPDRISILLLRETSDDVVAAIPNNKRVVFAKLILCTFDLKQKTLEITTRSPREAAVIRSFAGKKLGVTIGFDLKDFSGNTNIFFENLLDVQGNKGVGIVLNGIVAKESVGDLKTQLAGAQSPDQIAGKLLNFKESGFLQFKDISEFQSFRFQYKQIDFHVRVAGNKWGQKWLHLSSASKPKKELSEFKNKFESHFRIEFEKAIGGSSGDKTIAQMILDKTQIDALLPKKVEDIFLSLVSKGILSQPTRSSKRKCLSCTKISWQTAVCPSCGGDLMILGTYLEVIHNRKKIFGLVKKYLSEANLGEVKIRTKKIGNKNHVFLVVSKNDGTPTWFYVSCGEAVGYIRKVFEHMGTPIIFIFSKHGKNTNIGEYAGDYCRVYNLLDIVYDLKPRDLDKAIDALHESSITRRIKAANLSFKRLTEKPRFYFDQEFEQDVFNLLHELTTQAEMLGGTFTGVRAPDGVGAITNRRTANQKKITFAWDCKFSTLSNGYKLSDEPKKHRHYISALSKNTQFISKGQLKTFLFISQNMNKASYKSFYNRLTKNYKWKGQVLFLGESALLEIFRIYTKLRPKVENDPAFYFEELIKLLTSKFKLKSADYPHIDENRIKTFTENLIRFYGKVSPKFSLKRSDFDRG